MSEIEAIGFTLGVMLPIHFWIAISLQRIANNTGRRRDPLTGVLSRD